MRPKRGLSVALLVSAGAFLGAVAPQQNPPGTSGVLLVRSGGEGGGGGAAVAPAVVGIGFAAAPGHVVAYLPSDLPDTVMVADESGTAAEGVRLVHDSVSGLALLAVPTLGVGPYPFVFDSARVGQEVVGATRNAAGDSIEMAVGSVVRVESSASGDPAALIHNASLAGQFNLGAPLLNLCGEVVGGIAPGSERAVPAARLVELFGAAGLEPETASEPCLTAEEQTRQATERAEAAQARADSAEARAREAEERAASTGNPGDQATADSLTDLAASAQARADSAQMAAASARAQADREREQSARQDRIYRWIIVGLVVLAMFGVLAWVVSVRSATRAKQERERAEQLARGAQADLEDRESRDQLAGQVPSALLDGGDAHGNPYTVSVPGREIASPGGAVVGRNPLESAIVLDHPEISRRHFRLSVDGIRILIDDLHSTNGTWVGNAPLSPERPVELRDGDTVQVGGVTLRVTLRR